MTRQFVAVCCDMGPACIFPRCRGYDWVGKSKDAANMATFQAQVTAYMQMTGETDHRVAALAVYDAAKASKQACPLS